MNDHRVDAHRSEPRPACVGVDASEIPGETYLTKREVARRLGKTVRTISNWMRQGLPYYKRGRTVLFLWPEVRAFLRHIQCVAPSTLLQQPSPSADELRINHQPSTARLRA